MRAFRIARVFLSSALGALLTLGVALADEERLGEVSLPISCSAGAQQQFNRAVAMQHSFFFPETVKAFTAIAEKEPSCAMAYWGIAISQRASALKTGNVGVLRVGATPQVIENLLADFLSRYRKRHAGVEIHLVEDGGSRLAGHLDRGDIDVAQMPAGEDRFSSRLLYPMHVLAVVAQGHRLGRHTVLDVTELVDEPLLRLNSTFASHGWFEAACQVAHIRPRVLLESVAPQTLIALARAGHGVAVVPSPVRIPRTGVRAAVVVHRGMSIGRWTVAAWESQRFLPPYAVQFVEELVDHCRRSYPGHDYSRRAPLLPRPQER